MGVDATYKPIEKTAESTDLRWVDILYFIRKRWISLFVGVIAGGLIGFGYTTKATPIYMATSEVLIKPRTIAPLRLAMTDSILSLDVPYIDTQIAVMRSGSLADKILTSLELWNDEEFADSEVPPGTADTTNSEQDRASVVERFQRQLFVRRKGQSYVIEVSFTSRDPEKAARITNAVAEGYMSDQVEARADLLGRGNEWFVKRIERIRRKMNDATFALNRFKARGDYRLSEAEASPGSKSLPTLDELEAAAKTYRNLYEQYLHKQTDSIQQQSFPIPNARIITPALVPLDSSLRVRWVILLAAAAGGLIGFAFALMRHSMAGSRPD